MARDRPAGSSSRDLNEIIGTIFPLLQADALERSSNVNLSLDPLPAILVNENEIRQLLHNLVRNGLEVARTVTIRTEARDSAVVLSVTDDGPGIPPEIRDKIGTPFFTTKEKGNGLGLAVCRNIVSRHGGELTFKTGPGGTTFFIRFPVDHGNAVVPAV